MLLLQLVVSALILLFFSAYLWFVQLKYDGSKVGYERALFYALLVFGAGFSYDCAKRILFLPQAQFVEFGRHLGEAVLHLLFIIVMGVASGLFFSVRYTFAGQLAYLMALGWLWFFISSSTLALEVANRDGA